MEMKVNEGAAVLAEPPVQETELPVQESAPEKVNSLQLKNKRRKRIILGVKYFFCAIFVVVLLFPFLFMVMKSFMSAEETMSGTPVHFFPKSFTLENYGVIGQFLPNLGNTLLIIVINATFIPLSACFVAFPLARRSFTGKRVMFSIIMSTIMIPSTVLMIPQYILFRQLGFYDKLISQWIGCFWGGGALNIFLVIQFMRGFPREMDEAARIDGANDFQIFFHIILPLCSNIILFISITAINGYWMDFQGPLIFLKTESKYTVGLAFYYFYNDLLSQGSVIANEARVQLMAMSVFMSLVPMVLYFFFQDKMVGGIKLGAVKG